MWNASQRIAQESVRRAALLWKHVLSDPRSCPLQGADELKARRCQQRAHDLREAAVTALRVSDTHDQDGKRRVRDEELFEAADPPSGSRGSRGSRGTPIIEIRRMRPIELGLLFGWMANDEDSGQGPKWWSMSASLFVSRWEESSALTEPEIVGLLADIATAVDDRNIHAGSMRALCMESALEARVIEQSGLTRVVGAFAPGHRVPVGFGVSRVSEPFSIDAMGARSTWRRRGVGTAIAQDFISAARSAGEVEFSIESKPGAVAFWGRQGLRLGQGSSKSMTLRL